MFFMQTGYERERWALYVAENYRILTSNYGRNCDTHAGKLLFAPSNVDDQSQLGSCGCHTRCFFFLIRAHYLYGITSHERLSRKVASHFVEMSVVFEIQAIVKKQGFPHKLCFERPNEVNRKG